MGDTGVILRFKSRNRLRIAIIFAIIGNCICISTVIVEIVLIIIWVILGAPLDNLNVAYFYVAVGLSVISIMCWCLPLVICCNACDWDAFDRWWKRELTSESTSPFTSTFDSNGSRKGNNIKSNQSKPFILKILPD